MWEASRGSTSPSALEVHQSCPSRRPRNGHEVHRPHFPGDPGVGEDAPPSLSGLTPRLAWGLGGLTPSGTEAAPAQLPVVASGCAAEPPSSLSLSSCLLRRRVLRDPVNSEPRLGLQSGPEHASFWKGSVCGDESARPPAAPSAGATHTSALSTEPGRLPPSAEKGSLAAAFPHTPPPGSRARPPGAQAAGTSPEASGPQARAAQVSSGCRQASSAGGPP